jgi:hypothetical protein
MRVLADLNEAQIDALAAMAKDEKTSRAALLREAVDDLIAKRRRDVMEQSFGLWKGRVPFTDGVEMQEALRSEWDGR